MKQLVAIFSTTLFFLIFSGCDIRENALVREQSETFEKELSFRQKTNQELANKLKVTEEKIRKLEKQLQCREQLIDENVEQAKKDVLDDYPIVIE